MHVYTTKYHFNRYKYCIHITKYMTYMIYNINDIEAYRNICIECSETQRKDLCVFLYGKH